LDFSDENTIPKNLVEALVVLIEGNSMEYIKRGLALADGHIFT
jgi:hypothetical protein